MRPGYQLHGFREDAVTGDLVVGVIELHDLGQHVRVPGVPLHTRGRVPFPVFQATDIWLIAYFWCPAASAS
jgi:hypothetical protein